MNNKIARSVFWLALATGVSSCGGDDECVVRNIFNSPSGKWSGILERVESDCSDSRGASLRVSHDVTLTCALTDDPEVRLVNEDGLEFDEVSFSTFGGSSFEVVNDRSRQRINIRYENYEGDLADVEQKIRNYRDGEIVCSELYRGQLKR
jgi:hypothetical protein